MANIDKTVTCLVQTVNDDGTLNVSILPDTTTVLKNIINESKYTFEQGDYAVMYMIGGRPSNSFIICRYDSKAKDFEWAGPVRMVEDQIQNLASNMDDAIDALNQRIDSIVIGAAPVTSVNGRDGDVIGLAELTDVPTFTLENGVLTIHTPS